MRVAIIEMAVPGHPPIAESLIKIYSAIPGENEVFVFCSPAFQSVLKGTNIAPVHFILRQEAESDAEFFQKINEIRPDKGFIITLEASSKSSFALSKAFYKADFNFPVYLFIHNIDTWFGGGFWPKLGALVKVKTRAGLILSLRTHFLFQPLHQKILAKVLANAGKLAVISQAVGRELEKFVPKNKVVVVPFSVYEKTLTLQDQPAGNKLRVCMPGYVSIVRRDYSSVLNMLDGVPEIKDRLELDFLGGIVKGEGGEQVLKMAAEYQDKGFHIRIENRKTVDIREFDQRLSEADIILCNLNLVLSKTNIYGKTKESGIPFAMIKAAKPGILPVDYQVDPELESSVLRFSNYDEVIKILQELIDHPERLNRLKEQARINSEKYAPLEVYKRIENIENT